jgi:hypothetical protein
MLFVLLYSLYAFDLFDTTEYATLYSFVFLFSFGWKRQERKDLGNHQRFHTRRSPLGASCLSSEQKQTGPSLLYAQASKSNRDCILRKCQASKSKEYRNGCKCQSSKSKRDRLLCRHKRARATGIASFVSVKRAKANGTAFIGRTACSLTLFSHWTAAAKVPGKGATAK